MNAELLALEQLGERDMRFIVSTLVPDANQRARVTRLARSEPKALEAMLSDQRLAKRIISDHDILLRISPYLYFAVLLRQVHRDLDAKEYTPEWSTARSRLPVFDAAVLAKILTSLEIRHYLAEMLASFVRLEQETKDAFELVADVAQAVGLENATANQLFNDWGVSQLDVEALIRLGAESPHAQRLAVFRRVGDVALLLTGVFPAYAQPSPWLHDDQAWPWARRHGPSHKGRPSGARQSSAPQKEIEEIGRRYYRMAARHPNANWLGWETLLTQLSEEFSRIRKILNLLADSYIHDLGPFTARR